MFIAARSAWTRLVAGAVARGSMAAAVLQVAELVLGFLVAVILSRALGTAEFGVYSFGVSVAGVLSIPAILGYETLAVRDVARCRAAGDWLGLNRFVGAALLRVFASSVLVVAVAGFAGSILLARYIDVRMMTAALVGLALVPLMAMLRLHEAVLRGWGRVSLALLPDKAVRPALLVLLASAGLMLAGVPATGLQAIALALAVSAFGLTLLVVMWQRIRPHGYGPGRGSARTDPGWRSAMAFAWISGVLVVNEQADILMLGALAMPEDVGVYRIAGRMAMLVGFAVSAVGLALGPRIAILHAENRLGEIEAFVVKAAIVSVAAALPMAVLFVAVGPQVLSIFGEGFTAGAPALMVLSVSRLIVAVMGHVGLLMVMSGYERQVSKILAVSAVLNVVLNAILIPPLGTLGAALATAVTMIGWNLAMVLVTYRGLRINPTLLGLFWPCRRGERAAVGAGSRS